MSRMWRTFSCGGQEAGEAGKVKLWAGPGNRETPGVEGLAEKI